MTQGGHISTEPRINERIRVPEVRLVGPAGEQVGIVAINDALRLAQEADLDLVEVAPMARPPVCKLMDYGKFKYESALKARESRKNQAQTVIKEIKLRPKIDPHDYGTKKGHVERFLKQGDKVKVTIMFRGREQSRPELGFKLLQRLAGDIEELGFVESSPKQDGRNMIMVIGPHKRKTDAMAAAKADRASRASAAQRPSDSADAGIGAAESGRRGRCRSRRPAIGSDAVLAAGSGSASSAPTPAPLPARSAAADAESAGAAPAGQRRIGHSPKRLGAEQATAPSRPSSGRQSPEPAGTAAAEPAPGELEQPRRPGQRRQAVGARQAVRGAQAVRAADHADVGRRGRPGGRSARRSRPHRAARRRQPGRPPALRPKPGPARRRPATARCRRRARSGQPSRGSAKESGEAES